MRLMDRALKISVEMEDVLFPHMAISVLVEVYGARLDIMRPKTIYSKVTSLCMKNGYDPEHDDVVTAVNGFLCS